MQSLSLVAADIQKELRTLNSRSVLALWADGSFTVEHAVRRGLPRRNGIAEQPIATFTPGWAQPTLGEITAKLQEATPRLRP